MCVAAALQAQHSRRKEQAQQNRHNRAGATEQAQQSRRWFRVSGIWGHRVASQHGSTNSSQTGRSCVV